MADLSTRQRQSRRHVYLRADSLNQVAVMKPAVEGLCGSILPLEVAMKSEMLWRLAFACLLLGLLPGCGGDDEDTERPPEGQVGGDCSDAADNDGETALHRASGWDKPKCVKLLLKHGAVRSHESDDSSESESSSADDSDYSSESDSDWEDVWMSVLAPV